jgi:2-amino-4-hydroxy-6-hydroxymethyldihydropteridine diphosphokinase
MSEDPTDRERGDTVQAFVGVGSNIRPGDNVLKAVALLARRASLRGVSTFYRTSPVGAGDTRDFYNGVLEIMVDGDVKAVRRLLADVEGALGRVRTEDPHAARVIDLDLLTWQEPLAGGDTADVHPDVTRRGFVALPLLELAPELVLGDSGRPLAEVAERFEAPPGQPLVELSRRLRSLVR